MSRPTASAVVVGGGGGIGGAVAERIAATHALAIGYLTDRARADAVVARIGDTGGIAVAVGSDVSTDGGVDTIFAAAEDLGPLRTVIHCAGAWDYTKVENLTADTVERDFRTNLKSALLSLSAAARRVSDGGRIVLLSSAAAHLAPARQASYAAMKAGLEAAARVAAKELGQRSITVNVVRPGATDTERLRTSTAERAIEAMGAANTFRRLGTPDDIAKVVEWLITDDAAWVTAAVIDANGGLF
jgi:3-oxoacyl-[acyl-carrier protein] reductase